MGDVHGESGGADSGPAERRGRGRPREVFRRPPGEGTPVEQGPGGYPRTARAILEAAQRVLIRDGGPNLTLVAVAREAHVDVTTVTYHFVTRAGLIEALFDFLYAEPVSDLIHDLGGATKAAERDRALFEAVRIMYEDRDATLTYFEIAVMALRDPALAARIARYNDWMREQIDRATLVDAHIDDIRAKLAHAAIDGVELHSALAGDSYPTEEVLVLLEQLLHPPASD